MNAALYSQSPGTSPLAVATVVSKAIKDGLISPANPGAIFFDLKGFQQTSGATIKITISTQYCVMQNLIQETLTAFQKRSRLNCQSGFHVERDTFNEILMDKAGDMLPRAESDLYQRCRQIINCGLESARSKDLNGGLEQFRKIEAVFGAARVSYPCKMVIAAFYCSGLAYIRLKESRPEEADKLSILALVIDNYLIQEYNLQILEMHRVQQLVNLARIRMALGQREAACRLLFALIRCFEGWPEPPLSSVADADALFRKEYPASLTGTSPVGRLLAFEKIKAVPVTRFDHLTGKNGMKATKARFMLDFSDLSFDLIKSMLDQIIDEFIRFTRGLNPPEVIEMLKANGFRSTDDLNGLKPYESACFFLTFKLQAADEDLKIFLKSLKSFCALPLSQPVWEAIVSDFYIFCNSSEMITPDIKEQIRIIAEIKNLKTNA